MEFLAWPSIVNFYSLRKYVVDHPSLLEDKRHVVYRSKVKLHGTNSAVHVTMDGQVGAQSRSRILAPDPEHDNAGFASWVFKNKELWATMAQPLTEYIIFGEWCGSNINKGCAIHSIPNRILAIFAIVRRKYQSDDLLSFQEDFIVSPEEIKMLLPSVPDVYILPWYGDTTAIAWLDDVEDLDPVADAITSVITDVEKCDPWVKEIFDLEGIGEGLVYYPISHSGREAFANLAFKAKGEEHKTVGSARAAQVKPPQAENVEAFANLVCTPARLEQGAIAICGEELKFQLRNIGKFLEWICKDVQKETPAELAASGLEWKPACKAVAFKARSWYLTKIGK